MGNEKDLSRYAVPPGGHTLPPPPYSYNALEPVISENVVNIHYNKHHASYVEGLNKAELKLLEARRSGDFSLIKHWERELAFHGSGHILHSIYWAVMGPPGKGGYPGPQTACFINSYFESFDAFKAQFTAAAVNVEGSGWAILVWQPSWQRLEILTAEKHQDLTQWGAMPILVIDVWEHAYYLDYQNHRAGYVDAWWQLVNWGEVEKRLHQAMQGRVPLVSLSGGFGYY